LTIIIDSERVLDSNWRNLIFRNMNIAKDNIGISSLVFRILDLDSNWRNLMNIAITDSERDLDIDQQRLNVLIEASFKLAGLLLLSRPSIPRHIKAELAFIAIDRLAVIIIASGAFFSLRHSWHLLRISS
jgi:hypothetical protein